MSLWALLILLLAPGVPEGDSTSPQLEISHRARSLQPGEVVWLRVKSSAGLKTLVAAVFEKSFTLNPSEDGTLWEGLIGIDLEIQPGPYSIDLEGQTEAGETVHGTYALIVSEKEFPTRYLSLPEKYVNPPEEVLSRIQRESERIREIFATASPQRIWEGKFISPVPGAPTSSFGKRSILNNQPRSPHSGTDFDAERGTAVKSPNRGTAVLAADLYYSGNTVIVDHGQGLYSYFAHLSKFAVKEGEAVSAGQIIGHVGATGRVTGPHLHWSVRLNETRVDPLSLIALFSEETGESN